MSVKISMKLSTIVSVHLQMIIIMMAEVVVGVEEENGVAKSLVKGLPEYMLDSIQKDMLGYNNLISPPYFPQGIHAEVDGKWIFVIVVRTGQQRPYKSPKHVTSKKERSTIIIFVIRQVLLRQIVNRSEN